MKIKRCISFALVSLLIANFALTSFAEDNQQETPDNYIQAEEEYESSTPYVLCAVSNDGNIEIACNKLEYYGNLSAGKNVNIFTNQLDENGLRLENDESYALESFETCLNNYDYNIFENRYISEENSLEAVPVKCKLYSNSSSKIELNSVLNSQKDIEMSAQTIKSEDDYDNYIYSSDGNVSINCDTLNYTGIIYAPNGDVTISANSISIKGCIIAKNIIFNANTILVKEDYELFKKYEDLDAEQQEENEELIKEYMNVVDQINDENSALSEEQESLNNEYDELRSELESKNMLLSEEEVREFFESEYEKSQNAETSDPMLCAAVKKFKPCDGIEKLYDVIRETGTSSYNKKSYQYYSMIVCDKPKAKKNKFSKYWYNDVVVTGSIEDTSKAKKYLNSAFQLTFGKGANKILSSLGRPISGAIVSAALSKIYPFGKPTPADLVLNGKQLHVVEDVQVYTRMRYYWVKYKQTWQFAYACNFAVWTIQHKFTKYNSKTHKYVSKTIDEVIDLDGTFFKPPVAVRTIVEHKKLYGEHDNNGYYPFGWDCTPNLTITNNKGKDIVFKTPFYANTISLM